jgi:TolA-binding protein
LTFLFGGCYGPAVATFSRAVAVAFCASARPALSACAANDAARRARFLEHTQAAEAQWWIGGTHDQPRDFRPALAAFERGARDYPASAAAARARTLLASRSATSRAR